jgi:hypothetical protein
MNATQICFEIQHHNQNIQLPPSSDREIRTSKPIKHKTDAPFGASVLIIYRCVNASVDEGFALRS